MTVEDYRRAALDQFTSRRKGAQMLYEHQIRLECLRLAISKGAGEPVGEARAFYDFVVGTEPAPSKDYNPPVDASLKMGVQPRRGVVSIT